MEATTVALSLSGAAGDFLTQILGQMTDKMGETEAAYRKVAESLDGRLTIALGKLQDIMLEFGIRILPVVVRGAEILASALGVVSDAVGFLMDANQMLTDFFVGRMVGAFNLVSAAAATFIDTFIPQPVQDFLSQVGGVVVDVTTKAINLTNKVGGVGAMFGILGNVVHEAASRIGLTFQAIGDYATAAFLTANAEAALGVDSMIASIIRFGNAAANTFEGALAAIKAIWGTLPAAIGDLVIGAANAMIHGINSMLAAAVTPFNTFIDGVNSALAAMHVDIVIAPISAPSVGDLPNEFAGAAEASATAAADAFNAAFADNPLTMPNTGLATFAAEAQAAADAMTLVGAMSLEAANKPLASLGALSVLLQDTSTSAVGAGQNLAGMGETIAGIAVDPADIVDPITDAGTAAAKTKETVDSLTKAINDGLISAVDSFGTAFGDWVASGFRDFKSFTSSIVDSFKKAVSDMVAAAVANPIKLMMGMQMGEGGAWNVNPASMLGKVSGGIGQLFGGIGAGFGGVLKAFSSGGLSGAAGALTGSLGGITSGLGGLGTAIGALAAPVAAVALLFSAFRTKTTLLNSGLQVSVAGLEAAAQSFSTTKKSSFFGLINRTSTSYGALDGQTTAAVLAAVGDVQQGVLKAATSLGIAGETFKDFAYTLSVSTVGMSKDDALAAVQAKFAEMGDAMAGMVTGLNAFAKPGEGLMVTLQRLATASEAVIAMTDTLGLSFEWIGLQGANLASKLVDAFGGLDAMSSAVGAYYEAFYSDAERRRVLIRQTKDAFEELGLSMPRTRDGFRSLVEAQDLTTEAGRATFAALIQLSGALDTILPVISNLTAKMMHIVETASRQVDKLITSTTEAMDGAKQAAQVWHQVSAQLRSYISDLRGTASELISAASARAHNEMRYQTTLASALAGSVSAYGKLTGVADSLIQSATDNAHTSVEAAIVQARVIGDLRKAAMVAENRGDKKATLADLLDRQVRLLTRIKSQLANADDLSARQITILSRKLGRLQVDIPVESLARPMDFLRTSLDDLAALVRRQLRRANAEGQPVVPDGPTEAEKAAAALIGAQSALATAAASKQSSLTAAQAMVDKVRAFDAGINGTLGAVGLKGDGTVTWGNRAYGTDNQERHFQSYFFQNGGLDDQARAASAKLIADNLALATARQQVIDLGGVPAFARGGWHGGGLRLVGERGPELEATGPSRIYSAGQTAQMMDGGSSELVSEIRLLRDEIRDLRDQNKDLDGRIATNTRRTARLQEQWETTGMPPQRAIL